MSQFTADRSTRQAHPAPIGTAVPTGATRVTSPGTRPSSQTLRMRAVPSAPAPCTSTHVAAISPRIAHVMTGRLSVGFSSPIGNMARGWESQEAGS